jgi:nicotinate-nucleotide adenylyltransferase
MAPDEQYRSIGILGGTFNPVHLGHLILAQDAFERLELSQVLFVPASVPPHKIGSGVVSAEHRLAMLEFAVEGDMRFGVSDIEIARAGVSYSIDTARAIRRSHPESQLYFIIGADSLSELHQWKDIYELLELCIFVPFSRPGAGASPTIESIRLNPPWPERLLSRLIVGHAVDISSSDVRRRVAEGLGIRYLVSESVAMYIDEHGLYT